MKRWFPIAILVWMVAFSACNPRIETQNVAFLPHADAALQAVDSLMWRQPDSALAVLLDYWAGRDALHASPDIADSLQRRNHCVSTTFDDHYAHLLLAELLYKNDYEQTNREELLKAVVYFDSLTFTLSDNSHAFWRHCGLDPQSPDLNDNIIFLDARAHYINGVGYYEKDSIVQACAEYLKASEVMAEHFEEKELVGKKAQFMAYIYNRLGDMFEEQLLAEPAIACYKQALFYCRRESTSKYGIPVLLYRLGIQYDIVDQKDSTAFYYDEALANMPDFDNIHYRDLMVNKIVFAFYNLDYSTNSIIESLKYYVTLSADEEERTTRLLTLGNILFEAQQYDSSRVYLETIFEQQEDITSKIMAAENLSSIYQMEGDSVKAQKYASFLVGLTMSEIEKKTEVSKVNEMFKEHLAKEQERQAEMKREKAVKKALWMIIPIAVAVAMVVFIVAKHRNKKQLKEQQVEANRVLRETVQQHAEELRQREAEAKKALEYKDIHHQQEMEAKEAEARKELEEKDKQYSEVLEAERQTHRMEQAAIAGRLKRSNQELRELKEQIKQLDDLAAKAEVAASFDEEPICRLIMDRVNEGQFKSKIDYIVYKDYALDKQQLLDLRMAVDRHFGQFTIRLKKAYPELTNSDLDYCCLYLLGLNDADIAALMQRTYNTVFERNGKMRKIFGSDNPLPITLMGMAKDFLFI